MTALPLLLEWLEFASDFAYDNGHGRCADCECVLCGAIFDSAGEGEHTPNCLIARTVKVVETQRGEP